MEGRMTMLSTGPITPVDGPDITKSRHYVADPDADDALNRGPALIISISYIAAFPREWFEGLGGMPVDVPGAHAFFRETGDQISLVVLYRDWVVSVDTRGVRASETMKVARSFDFG
jgi:hypothetical protein